MRQRIAARLVDFLMADTPLHSDSINKSQPHGDLTMHASKRVIGRIRFQSVNRRVEVLFSRVSVNGHGAHVSMITFVSVGASHCRKIELTS
jgi:hypothetical protein